MEYNEIIGLMQEMTKTGLTRVKIEEDGFKLVLENNIGLQSSITEGSITGDIASNSAMSDNVVSEDRINKNLIESNTSDNSTEDRMDLPGTKKILSPMVGTFYGQPSPDKPPYVKVGDVIKKGQTVCIIEAMKLMNEIECEADGEIIECLVENEDMVEFGQPLFIIKEK